MTNLVGGVIQIGHHVPAVDLAAAGPQPTCSSLILKQIPLGTRLLTWFGPTAPVYFRCNLCAFMEFIQFMQFMHGFAWPARARTEPAPPGPRRGPFIAHAIYARLCAFMQFMWAKVENACMHKNTCGRGGAWQAPHFTFSSTIPTDSRSRYRNRGSSHVP